MELNVGMYIRTKDKNNNQFIRKIIDMPKDTRCGSIVVDKDIHYVKWVSMKNILKASYNIIDLIKPKDIILGKDGKLYQCWKIYKDYVFTYSKNSQGQTITLVDYQIDKILTKEQFENMSYKVGD